MVPLTPNFNRIPHVHKKEAVQRETLCLFLQAKSDTVREL